MNLWKTEGWSFRVIPFLVLALVVTITLAWGCTETDPKSRHNASVTDGPLLIVNPGVVIEPPIVDGYDTTWLWWPVYSHSQIIPSQGPEDPPDTIIGDTHYIHVRIQDLPVGMIRSDTPVWLPPQF